MNILILTSHLNIGGIPRYVINLAKGLSEHHSIFVASCGGEWQKRLKGAEHIYIPLNTKFILSFKILKSFFVLKKFIGSNKIDIVHANTRVSQALAFLLWKFLKVPYVSTFHGNYRGHLFRKLFKFEGLKTIAISKDVKDYICLNLGIDKNKIELVYNGMDCAGFKEEAKGEPVYIEGDPLIGCISRLSPEKNIPVLINAFGLILKDYPKARLVICGKGRAEVQLKQMVKEKKISERVLFIKDAEPCRVLAGLDVFVYPSLREPFGYSLIEAQCMGTAVVAFAKGSFKEIIEDGLSGLLVKDNDPFSLYQKIKEVLDNPSLRERLVSNARQYLLSKFSLEGMARGTYSVYRKALCKEQ